MRCTLLCLFFSGERERERTRLDLATGGLRDVAVNTCVSFCDFVYTFFKQIERIFWSHDDISWSELLLVERDILIHRPGQPHARRMQLLSSR